MFLRIAELAGLLVFFSSVFFRRPDAPRAMSWNIKEWTPVWKQRKYYRPLGFWLMNIGLLLFGLAFIVRLPLGQCW